MRVASYNFKPQRTVAGACITKFCYDQSHLNEARDVHHLVATMMLLYYQESTIWKRTVTLIRSEVLKGGSAKWISGLVHMAWHSRRNDDQLSCWELIERVRDWSGLTGLDAAALSADVLTGSQQKHAMVRNVGFCFTLFFGRTRLDKVCLPNVKGHSIFPAWEIHKTRN